MAKFDSAGHELGLVDNCGFCQTAAATDLSTDDLYVDDMSYVAEYDSAQNQLPQFGSAQLASGGSGGIAVDPLTGDVFVANAADGKVYVFGPTPGSRVVPEAATNVQTTTATVNALVNPEGSETTYQFEYGTTTSYGQTAPALPADAGSGSSQVAASTTVGELEGGTTYHYRIVASNANGSVHSADRTFTTMPVPVIDSASTANLTAGSVDLTAAIDPKGLDATYHFEYGLSTAYGASVPVPDADIGAGTGDVAVSQHVAGLQANTTYHWRVIAHDSNGTTTGSDHTFVYDTTGGGLPDNRAYEMVTPPQKNGAAVGNLALGAPPAVAENGSRLVGVSIQCFASAGSCTSERGNSEGEPYAFTRGSGGWVTTAMAPPATQFGQNTQKIVNADTGSAVFSIATPPAGEDDFYVRRPDGSFVDVGPSSPPSSGPLGSNDFVSSIDGVRGTADFSHIVYEGHRGGRWPFDATAGEEDSVYEYVGAGNPQPALVGVSGGSGSTDLISVCGTELGAGGLPGSPSGLVSADGDIVYFTADKCAAGSGVNASIAVPADELYARIDGSRTVLVSGRSPLDCTSAACLASSPGDAHFEGASGNGSKVFFTDTQQLTDSANEDSHSGDSAQHASGCLETIAVNGCNLYEYDFSNPSGHNLIDASAGDSSGDGPRVQGVVATSQDGSHVYFVAKGVLTGVANGRGQVARRGAENLYVFERDASHPEGRVAFIAALPASDSGNWNGSFHLANVTPDGRFLVFTSHGRLTADETSNTGAEQVFRYDAQTAMLVRISTGEHGFNDNGNAGVGTRASCQRSMAFVVLIRHARIRRCRMMGRLCSSRVPSPWLREPSTMCGSEPARKGNLFMRAMCMSGTKVRCI